MSAGSLSEIARKVMAEHETSSARLVNRIRYVFVLMFTGPLIWMSYQSVDPWAFPINIGALVLYVSVTILHSVKIRANHIKTIQRFNWVTLIADLTLMLGVILYWGFALSPEDFSFAAKTTGWLWVAVILAGTVLQFDRRIPLFALFISILTYFIVVAVMLSQGVETTGNWVEYINGDRVDLSDLLLTKPLIFCMLGLISAYTIKRTRGMMESIAKAESQRSLLSRYFSPSVVEDITSGNADLTRGHRQKATILFMDIRNFTKMSEALAPDDLIEWLSDFRATLTALVFKHNGSVDKFIGDAIMATFGTPRPANEAGRDTTNAVLCALDMLAACHELDQRWQARGIKNAIGIGIHTGEVFAGNIGDSDQIEYTVIGDAVNTASRIESLCKKLEHPLIISAAVKAELIGDISTRLLPRVQVKGKAEPLELYAVN